MQECDDITLLREYAERGSEEAFGALVSRHINKVYSVAMRQTGNSHQAEEITQAVFVILAQRSRKLGTQVILSAWLYKTAQWTAVTLIRSEKRRARREYKAHMQTFSNQTETDVWPQIAPLLDAAMAGLSERDRQAVVLRFFDGKSMREIGAAMGAAGTLVLLDPRNVPIWLGWRCAFGIGAMLGLIVIFFRRWIPESPRWLMIHGRNDEAEEIVAEVEGKILGAKAAGIIDAGYRDAATRIRTRTHTPWQEIWDAIVHEHRKRSFLGFVLMSTQAFFYNAIFFTYALVLMRFYGVP